MKKRTMFPLIALAMLLAVAIPSSALISFISIQVSPSTIAAGQNFQITVTAVESGSSPIMGISLAGVTQNCLPAQTCIKTWTLNEVAAGQYNYIIRAWNSNGQTALDSVTVNVQGGAPPATFLFRTASIDGAAFDNYDQIVYIDPSSVRILGVTKTGAPYATFTVPADAELDVYYNAAGYPQDWDVFYFDSRIAGCPSSGCSFTRDTFTTTCEYVSSPIAHFECGLTSSKYLFSIEFDYYPYDPELDAYNVIKKLNRMYQPGCPMVYGLTNVTLVNGQTYSGLDLDDYVTDSDTPLSELVWTVSKEDYVVTTIGMSNVISIVATDPNFAGSDIIRFTASDGVCSDSDDLLVIVNPANLPPTVTIDNPLTGENFTQNCGSIQFNSTVNDPDGTIISIEWIYGGTSISTQEDFSVPASIFAPGQDTVLVRVTDNNGATASGSVTFNILNHTNPICLITDPVLDPVPGLVYAFPFGQVLNFAATAAATDNCNVPLFQYFWRDNGIPIVTDQQSFSTNLSAGDHNITLYVTDGLGGECYDELLLNMTTLPNIPPTAVITSPLNGSVFTEDCEWINFSVDANDVDGTVSNILWYSGGTLMGTTQNISVPASSFGIGNHTVSVTVVDDDNAIATASVSFEVVDHTNPTIVITLPVNNPDPLTWYQFPENTLIDFSATATATDPCVPVSFQYIWRDNGIPMVTDMQSFSLDNLSIGLHNITVYTTDGFGGEAYDTLLLNITEIPNIPPVITSITCYNQFGGLVLSEHDPIFCNATATDPDGFITIWQWAVAGLTLPYNLGPVFNQTLAIPGLSYLAAGDYNVTLIVLDNETPPASAVASTVITVIPNQPPTVTITLPATDPFQTMEFCNIDFQAVANDVDGYIIPLWDPTYNWQVSMANGTLGSLTTEQNFTYIDVLPIGLNTFSVTVTDNDGAQGSDTLVVNITNNIPPTVNITLPVPFNNYTHAINRTLGATPITFDAAVTNGAQDDCADCTVADYTWTWYDTFLGSTTQVASTQSFVMNNPQEGIHTLTVQTTDCYGESSIDVIIVNVTELPNNNPIVTIITPSENETFVNTCDVIPFSATAVDPDGDDIASWMWILPNSSIISGQWFNISASSSAFSLGNNTMYAYASDNQTPAGIGSDSVSFNIIDHTGPDVTISLTNLFFSTPILNGSQVNESTPILFDATATPTDSCMADQFTYYWEDNGIFMSNAENFTRNNLTLGMHMIKVIVTDNYGYTGEDVIWINITEVPNYPPVVTITEPLENQTFVNVCEQIYFNATAVDPENHDIDSWMWILPDSSTVGSQWFDMSASAANFTLGNNTVTVYAQDNQSPPGIGSDTVNFNIIDHTGPDVTLTLTDILASSVIANGSSVNESRPILFDAAAVVTDICNASDFTYYWEDNGDFMSDLQSFILSNLTVGMHHIKVIVFDDYSYFGEDEIWINITEVPNIPPTAVILTPTNGQQFVDACEVVNFTSSVADADGNITGTIWMWNNTAISTAQNFSMPASSFFLGNNTVTLIVTDDNNGSATVNVVFEVLQHSGPAVTINSPLDGAMYNYSIPVSFDATATPTDVCMPTGYSWIWVADGNVTLSTNQSFINDSLPIGEHVITVFATDIPYGASGSDTVTINITGLSNDPPVVTIIEPTAGQQFIGVCEDVNFSATAVDPDGDDISAWLWIYNSSNLAAAQNFSLPASFFGLGNHTVTANALDNQTPAAVGSANVTFEVISHLNPTAAITSPASGSAFLFGTQVNFTGTATQNDLCAPPNFNYVWTDNGLPIGSGPSFNTSTLAVGIHNITMLVTDSYGGLGYDTIFVNITSPTNTPPVITGITCAPLNEWEPVTCTATIAPDPEGDGITTWLWTIGGIYGPDATTNNTYNIPAPYLGNGTYNVSLTVVDNGTPTGTGSLTVPIVIANNVPATTLVANCTNCGPEPAPVNFSCSVTGGNPPYVFNMNFGNGASDVTPSSNLSSVDFTFIYNDQGTYLAVCTVTDMDGDSSNATWTVTVTDVNPIANAGPDQTVNEGDTVIFNGSGSMPGSPSDPITLYEWDFDGDGIYDQSGPALIFPTYIYQQDGVYIVTLRVTDEDSSSTDTMVVTVNNVAPTGSIIGTYSGLEGVPMTFTATGFDPGVLDVLTYEWDFDYDGVTFTVDSSSSLPTYTTNFSDDTGGLVNVVALRVHDDYVAYSPIYTSSLFVANVAPIANAGGPYQCLVNSTVTLAGSAYDVPGDIPDFLYSWDLDNDGIYDDSTLQNPVYNCSNLAPGNYTVGLQVLDQDGGVGINSTTVVVSLAPVYGVLLSYPGDLNTTPGVNVAYTITIQNIGNVIDSYTISYENVDSAGTASLSTSSIGPLAPAASTTFTLNVGNLAAGIFRVNVTAVSAGNASIFDEIETTTNVSTPIVDIVPPVVTLQLPANGYVSAVNTLAVQYYVTDNMAATLTCNVWSDTSGTWQIDLAGQSTLNATSNTNTYVGLPNGVYSWNVQCSDGINSAFAPSNFTFTVNLGVVTPACSNLVDDDADLLIDYPFDPGCSNATDTDETDPVVMPACSDGMDNDLDGLIDFPYDPGCADAADNDETDPVVMPQCSDIADNDLDGLIDWPLDPGCSGTGDNNETNPAILPACSDGMDNDLDGRTDFPNDPGCVSAGDNDETDPVVMPQCFNTIDDDGDSLTDWPADPGCYAAGDNNESNAPGANVPPVANAGPDQIVLQGTGVSLNGTGSYDPDNYPTVPITYNWTQVSGPAAVTLTNPLTATPTFTATAAGTYVFRLTVFDGMAYSTDTVTITVNTIAQSIQTALALYNATGSPISTALPGQIVYAELSIGNNYNYPINNMLSNLTAAGFTIIGASDGLALPPETITSNIPALGANTIWWRMNAPAAAGSYPVTVTTEGKINTRTLTI